MSFFNVLKMFQHAVKRKITGGLSEKPNHWLDPAKEKYDSSLVEDTKILLSVLVLFLPLPVFWALFDQQVEKEVAYFFKMAIPGLFFFIFVF